MVINYVPGEECRVAIVEDGKLEELYVERFATASRVGNIYVGRVMNVEPSIQAAFVDFGVGENGFLHVSDLHPRYFPGQDDETTERVGFKTPRRERPPIQAALRRGDEVIVQVLKEGVGTKGPTVTSYLSIPGRFLVMMPGMDNIGVSRKVEDEDLRRKMRDILDQLELPENFGFILRTAGMDRTKTELKRDLAYLQRLWKDMERRLKTGGGKEKTRLLYSESDLLVRSLRDLLTSDISEVVIDHEAALKRASRFMKIVAPRGSTKLMQMPGTSPIFHAFGIEKQIHLIHAREVPLPSGGRLVIDQTEALVAIDVNSGKSRDSRNSEDNAYQTNLEAVDEICRQLRLRDMGGIVINDLIDMRHASNRKDIENRFKERLKRDRARSTVLAISEFGILEMTRQRMRPSHESVHFTDCPVCKGRGMVQKPDSVAAEAMRDLCVILDLPKVNKVEMVVAPRVAGDLLSTKRQMISRVERQYGKHVDVRVSETVSVDRVSFYAYDELGQDLEMGELPVGKKPKDLKPWVDPEDTGSDWADSESETPAVEPEPVEEAVNDFASHPIEVDDSAFEEDGPSGQQPGPAAQQRQGQGPSQDETTDSGGRKRRRRRGRRGRGGQMEGDESQGGRPPQAQQQGQQQGPQQAPPQGQHAQTSGPNGPPQGGQRPMQGPPRGQHTNAPHDGRQGGRDGGRGRGPGPNQGGGHPSEHAHSRGGGTHNRPIAPTGLPYLQGDHGDEQDGPVVGSDGHAPVEDGQELPPGAMPGDAVGPNGEEGGEGGEGGRRRRRRRRRGGRGRGNGPDGAAPFDGEVPGNAAESSPLADEQAADAFARSTDHVGQTPHQPPAVRAPMNGADTDQGDENTDGPNADGPNGPGEGGGEGGDGTRRRRRRRRGRGGRGGQGGSGGGAEGQDGPPIGEGAPAMPASAPMQSRPPRDQRNGPPQDRPPREQPSRGPFREQPPRDQGPRNQPRRDSRPPQDAPRSAPPPAPKPPAPKPVAGAGGDSNAPRPPRTLYGAAKRKLSASELNRRPKPE